jgi:hypothetical protein
MPHEIRGEVGESFRAILYRAFREAAIPEIELARRLGLPSQAAAHGRLRRQDSVTERALRETARALGYGVQLTLVPLLEAELAASAELVASQEDEAPREKPKGRRRKDATD